VLLIGIAALWMLSRPPSSDLPVVDLSDSQRHAAHEGASGAVPWRSPARDLAVLFPGGAAGEAEIVSLSRARAAIVRRLGAGYRMETTGLVRYPVRVRGVLKGHVVVRRLAGPHGSIELVVGIDKGGAVAGVVVQREREPEECAAVLSPGPFLRSFRGKTAGTLQPPDSGTPQASAVCADAARVVAGGIRELLTELEEALGSAGEAGRR
jgi:hypothetical protein